MDELFASADELLVGHEEVHEPEDEEPSTKEGRDDPMLTTAESHLDALFAQGGADEPRALEFGTRCDQEPIDGTDAKRLYDALETDSETLSELDGQSDVPDPPDTPPAKRRSKRRCRVETTDEHELKDPTLGAYVAHVHAVGMRKDASIHSDTAFPVCLRPGPPPHWTAGQAIRRATRWLLDHYGPLDMRLEKTTVPDQLLRTLVAPKSRLVLDDATPLSEGAWPRLHDVLSYTSPSVIYDDIIEDTTRDADGDDDEDNEQSDNDRARPSLSDAGYGAVWSEEGQQMVARIPSVSAVLPKVPAAMLLVGSMLLLRVDPRTAPRCDMFPADMDVRMVLLDGAVSPLDPLRTSFACCYSSLSQWIGAWQGAAGRRPKLAQLSNACNTPTGSLLMARAVLNPVFVRGGKHRLPLASVTPAVRAAVVRNALFAFNGHLEWGVPDLTATGNRKASALCQPDARSLSALYEKFIFARTSSKMLTALSYQCMLVLLSHVMTPHDVELIVRGAAAEAMLTPRVRSAGQRFCPSQPFDPAKLMALAECALAGNDIERGGGAVLRAALPHVTSVVPRAEEWVMLVCSAVRTTVAAYGVFIELQSKWPFACVVPTFPRVTAPLSVDALRMGHELFATPHRTLDDAAALRRLTREATEWPSSAREPDAPVPAITELPVHMRVMRCVDWDGSHDAAMALHASLSELALQHPSDDTALHVLLGGYECPSHFTDHVTRHLARTCSWLVRVPGAPAVPACASRVRADKAARKPVVAAEWVRGRRVHVHALLDPLPVGGVLLVLNAQRLPPMVVCSLIQRARTHLTVLDLGQDASVPPEFRSRTELLPVLGLLRRAVPVRTVRGDEEELEAYDDTVPARVCSLDQARRAASNLGLWFVRQPLSFRDRNLIMHPGALPERGSKLQSADLLFAPRVLYNNCQFYGPGNCMAHFVLDPEMTSKELRWLGQTRWIEDAGASPSPTVMRRELWVTGSDTRAALPFLFSLVHQQAVSLFYSWLPVFARMSDHN